jgi:hypothetical protein
MSANQNQKDDDKISDQKDPTAYSDYKSTKMSLKKEKKIFLKVD